MTLRHGSNEKAQIESNDKGWRTYVVLYSGHGDPCRNEERDERQAYPSESGSSEGSGRWWCRGAPCCCLSRNKKSNERHRCKRSWRVARWEWTSSVQYVTGVSAKAKLRVSIERGARRVGRTRCRSLGQRHIYNGRENRDAVDLSIVRKYEWNGHLGYLPTLFFKNSVISRERPLGYELVPEHLSVYWVPTPCRPSS